MYIFSRALVYIFYCRLIYSRGTRHANIDAPTYTVLSQEQNLYDSPTEKNSPVEKMLFLFTFVTLAETHN
jgi:hypothetical protein